MRFFYLSPMYSKKNGIPFNQRTEEYLGENYDEGSGYT